MKTEWPKEHNWCGCPDCECLCPKCKEEEKERVLSERCDQCDEPFLKCKCRCNKAFEHKPHISHKGLMSTVIFGFIAWLALISLVLWFW